MHAYAFYSAYCCYSMPNNSAMSGIFLCLCAWASQCAFVYLDNYVVCSVVGVVG